MPFVLVVSGLVILIAAVRGTEGELGHQLSSDMFGSGGYIYWGAAILAIGMIGYVPKLKGLSIAFLSLLLLSMILSNSGFFAQMQSQLAGAQSAPAAPANADVSTGWGTVASGGNTGLISSVVGGAIGAAAVPMVIP